MTSEQERAAEIAELMAEVTANPLIKAADLRKMIDALSAHRDTSSWWFQTENQGGPKNCLSPLVLQNMKLQFEAGTLDPNMLKFKNLLHSAIHYQQLAAQQKPQTSPPEKAEND